jgi:hypothetical protein
LSVHSFLAIAKQAANRANLNIGQSASIQWYMSLLFLFLQVILIGINVQNDDTKGNQLGRNSLELAKSLGDGVGYE